MYIEPPTRQTSADRRIKHLVDEKLYLAFSTRNTSAHGVTVFAAIDHVDGDSDAADRLGNLSALIGYRNSTFVVADAARLGWAVRVGSSFAPRQDRDTVANVLAARMPFDVSAHAHERPVIISAEARFEMVGCTGGFVQARLDNVTWVGAVDGDRTRFNVVAASIAFGGYVSARLGVALDIGVQWGSSGDGVIPDVITRVGALFDVAPTKHLSFVGHLGALSGDVVGADGSIRAVVRF